MLVAARPTEGPRGVGVLAVAATESVIASAAPHAAGSRNAMILDFILGAGCAEDFFFEVGDTLPVAAALELVFD